jgi:butyrate kinase
MDYKVLSINPGSTSTKIAVYENKNMLFTKTIVHSKESLAEFSSLYEQFEMRKDLVMKTVEENGVTLSELSAVAGRGGLLAPLKAGGYLINQNLVDALRSPKIPTHESNLGAPIAYSIATTLGIPSYIYDAESSDELADVARITGIPGILRESFCHVLNTKSTARKVAVELGGSYNTMNFIIAHIGGGVSVSAHENGRIVDVIPDDEGPFSPERSGGLPIGYVVDRCYSGTIESKKDFMAMLKKKCGLMGLLGTNDCVEVERRIADGDATARTVYDAFAYHIARGIGKMAPALYGKVDAVILTGGIAHSEYVTKAIAMRVEYLGKVIIAPGENEMEALALGALRILKGDEGYHLYE